MNIELWKLSLPLVGGVIADRVFAYTFMRLHRRQWLVGARKDVDISQILVDTAIVENPSAKGMWRKQWREAGMGSEILGQAQMFLDSVNDQSRYYVEAATKKMAFLELIAVGLTGLYAGAGFLGGDAEAVARGTYLSLVFLVSGLIDTFGSRGSIQSDLEELWHIVSRSRR